MILSMFYNIYNNYSRISNIWNIINKFHDIEYNDENLEKLMDLINCLEKDIIEGGCIYIKFMQWYISNLKAENCSDNDFKKLNDLLINRFEYIFNNCDVHDLEHTKRIFVNDFGFELDDYVSGLKLIASGSIGQVYKGLRKTDDKIVVIKVKHPNIDSQIVEFQQFSNFIVAMQRYSFLRRRYKLNFNFNDFMNDLQLQSDFDVEVSNNNQFRRLYKDNVNIYFPKVYVNSKNVIVS